MKILLLLSFLFFFSACSSPEKKEQQPEKVITYFLNWYKDNMHSLGKIELVNNSNNTTYDSTKFYTVNFDSTEKYLTAFKKSGFVSGKYIDQWRQYFKRCDDQFKKNPQNDGPATGFEFDFVMWSQDYEEALDNLDKMNFSDKEIKNDHCIVTANFSSGMKIKYWLTLENGKWLIDDIQNKSN